jgi:hypothetical protein
MALLSTSGREKLYGLRRPPIGADVADNEQPQPGDQQHDDPFGKQLEDAIRANEALLAGLKYELGQKTLEAQQGRGEMPSAFEVLQVKKLETVIDNDKQFAQARAMTRKRTGAAE